MKKSVASLKERLAGWVDWDVAVYQVGVCLGFWIDLGAPPGEDQWHGNKGVIWSDNPLGNALNNFLDELVKMGMLELSENETAYRWNINYKDDEINLE